MALTYDPTLTPPSRSECFVSLKIYSWLQIAIIYHHAPTAYTSPVDIRLAFDAVGFIRATLCNVEG